MNWPLVLEVKITYNHLLRMAAHPKMSQAILEIIAACQQASTFCPFIDADGTPHALVRGEHILHAQTVFDKQHPNVGIVNQYQRVPTLASRLQAGRNQDDTRILCQLFLQHGQLLLGEMGLNSYQNMASTIYDAMLCRKSFMFGQRYHGDHLIAYNFVAINNCMCSNQILNLRGCPSVRGQRCPSLIPTDRLNCNLR